MHCVLRSQAGLADWVLVELNYRPFTGSGNPNLVPWLVSRTASKCNFVCIHQQGSQLLTSHGWSRRPGQAICTQLACLLAIRFVGHPAHKAAHQAPQGYGSKLSESASESSGVPLVARLRRWLLRRGLNDFDRQAVPRVDATKPRQWLQKLLSEIPSQFDELVDTTRPCRWLMNRR